MDKRILNLREEIDKIDEKIITLLKSRMDVSKKVGELKATLHIPVEDRGREDEIIQRLGELADGILRRYLNHQSKYKNRIITVGCWTVISICLYSMFRETNKFFWCEWQQRVETT